MKKELSAVLLGASVAAASGSALALDASTDALDVTILESAIDGNTQGIIVADQINGNYDEIFTVTGLTGPNSGTFNTLALFNAVGWTNNGANSGDSIGLGEGSFGGEGYGIYAIFQAAGTFNDSNGLANPGGTISFNANIGGEIMLYADPLQDTTTDLLGAAMPGTLAGLQALQGNTGDDQLLGSATLLDFGEGSVVSGVGANGNFELIFSDWTLAPDGEAYFVAPRPFPLVLDVNGNFQEFIIPDVGQTAVIAQSSANAFFANPVPAPASLGLLGLGLLALGGVRKRKS